jgi:hypothetical protein
VSVRYAFQRAPSRWRRWHLIAIGAAVGAGVTLVVAAAPASVPDQEQACSVLRAGGSLDPQQAIDVVVQHGAALGNVAFRCPPVEVPGRQHLPAVPVTVVYPP